MYFEVKVITSVCDVTNKILSCYSNYIVDVVMWPNFGNSDSWPEKPIFRYGLAILHQCDKSVKTKSQKVLAANSYVCRTYRGKSGGVTKCTG